MGTAQPRNAMAAAAYPAIAQGSPGLVGAISAARGVMDLADACQQYLVLAISAALPALAPGVVAARANPQHRAHPSNLELVRMFLDELVSHRFGLLKNPAAFFKMSRSSLT